MQAQRALKEVMLIRSDQVDILGSSIDEEVVLDDSCRFPGHSDEYLIPVAASGSLLEGRKCELEEECHHTRVLVRHTLVAAAEKFGLLGKLQNQTSEFKLDEGLGWFLLGDAPRPKKGS